MACIKLGNNRSNSVTKNFTNKTVYKHFILLPFPKQVFKKCAGHLVTLDFYRCFSYHLVFHSKTSLCPEGSMAYLYFMQHWAFLLLSNTPIHLTTNTKMLWEMLKSSQKNNPKSMWAFGIPHPSVWVPEASLKRRHVGETHGPLNTPFYCYDL